MSGDRLTHDTTARGSEHRGTRRTWISTRAPQSTADPMQAKPDFRSFSLRVLRAARHARPAGELIEELCQAVQAVAPCDIIEFWLMDQARGSRWAMDAATSHFGRLPDIEPRVLETLRANRPCAAGSLPGCTELPTAFKDRLRATLAVPLRSTLCRALTLDEDLLGFLVLHSIDDDAFRHLRDPWLQDLTLTLAAALHHHQVHQAQLERVKELSCLYEMAQLAALDELDLDVVLGRVIELLPPSWQYPELTAARLQLDERIFGTRPFEPGWQAQRAAIVIAGSLRGFVEVAYTEPMPPMDEGPFLEEERRLIDTVAREAASLIERNAAKKERLALQEQLRHADRLATIGHLAAGVTHELNEPLGAILGFAQLARKHSGVPRGADRDLQKIEAAALHAREVTARLMHVGRSNTPQREILDVNSVVRDALAFLDARLARYDIRLQCALQADLPRVTANRAELQQIVINLVVNSIQAMPSGGDLSVTTRARDGWWVLEVQDSGVGMSSAVQARIFEPFFTTKLAADGTGLGLPVVRGIVESLGGDIRVQSGPEAGATFSVRIPVEPSSAGVTGGD